MAAAPTLAAALGEQLLSVDAHALPDGDEQVPAAVLVPLYTDATGMLRVTLTQRRADLRRHAGEIAFPGGRRDPEDADLSETALREAEEEIGLTRTALAIVGALERTSTFATNYSIHPFVALLRDPPHPSAWRLSEHEVAAVLEPSLAALRAARGSARVERRGFLFETDAYLFDDRVVWGATARILDDLLRRVPPQLDRPNG